MNQQQSDSLPIDEKLAQECRDAFKSGNYLSTKDAIHKVDILAGIAKEIKKTYILIACLSIIAIIEGMLLLYFALK
jgi:hypothetical protein